MLLNPLLYGRMLDLFGEVRIVKPGEEGVPPRIIRDPFTNRDFARWSSGDDRGEEYNTCCPFCGDSGFHLYVNHAYGTRDPCGGTIRAAKCFHNCLDREENRHKLWLLLSGVGRVSESARKKMSSMQVQRFVQHEIAVPESRPIAALPEDHKAVQYLRSRGFSPEALKAFDLGYGDPSDENFMIRDRLIIPIRFGGEFVGWQSRKIEDQAFGKKYYISPGLRKGNILYNYDVARHQPFVVITEGVFDVWRIGSPAVCVFGKSISEKQLRLISETWKVIRLFFDSDLTQMERDKSLERLRRTCSGDVQGVVLPSPYKDPGETPPEVLRDLLRRTM